MNTPPPPQPTRLLTGLFDPSHHPAPMRGLADGDYAEAQSGHGLLVPVNHRDLLAGAALADAVGWLRCERALNALDFP